MACPSTTPLYLSTWETVNSQEVLHNYPGNEKLSVWRDLKELAYFFNQLCTLFREDESLESSVSFASSQEENSCLIAEKTRCYGSTH